MEDKVVGKWWREWIEWRETDNKWWIEWWINAGWLVVVFI